ncbi:MAG: hypothetical protein Q9160_006711 [Pyrenula sp. 1 TL-2023]
MLALRTASPASHSLLNSPSSPSHASTPSSCTPNILPCRIHHDGPTKVTKRYWAPTTNTEADGNKTRESRFRGRRLRGRVVKIPQGYEGVVAEKTGKELHEGANGGDGREDDLRGIAGLETEDEDDGEGDVDCGMGEKEEISAGILEEKATFNEIVVWGHDELPEKGDVFVKGVEEWIAFSEAMHGNTVPGEKEP